MSDAPRVFLPYQARWVADPSPVKVAEKGRRCGITWAEAADNTLLAASEKDPQDVLYTGYNAEMTREYIDTVGFWAKHFNRAAGEVEEFMFKDEDKDILTFRIRFATGKEIVALSSRPSNFRGRQGKVVVDEAAFHPDLKGLLKAAMALLMWGGRLAIISTHDGDENPFNDLVQEIRAGKKPYSLHRITFDDALAEGLYKRICLRLGKVWTPDAQEKWREDIVAFYGDGADEELFCIPAQGSGVWLSRALVSSCMEDGIPILRWACPAGFEERPAAYRARITDEWIRDNLAPVLAFLPPNLKHYLGEDFGRSGDLTTLLALTEMPNLIYRTAVLIELRNVPFRQQEQILFYLCENLPRFSGAAMDARGNGQSVAEVVMQEFGAWRIHRIMLSEAWYRDHMPPYKAALEDKTIILPRDADVLDDHRLVRMVRGVAKPPDDKRTRGSDGGQRHGDTAMAGALAVYATQNIKWQEDFSIQTAVPRQSSLILRGF
jgi:phage FluMu gp28-like protein